MFIHTYDVSEIVIGYGDMCKYRLQTADIIDIHEKFAGAKHNI